MDGVSSNEERAISINDEPSPQQLEGPLNTSMMYMDGYLKFSHLLFAVIGIPLNLGVIVLIVGLKRLHLQRTFSWLGLGFANIFLLLVHLVELQAVHWPSPFTEQLYAKVRGLPYVAILFSNFFSFLERHACVKHSKWYKRHITSCWMVLAGQIGSFTLICLIVKVGRYLIETFSFPSQIRFVLDMKIYSSFVLATFAVCATTELVLWILGCGWTTPAKRDDGIEFRTTRITPRMLEDGILTQENAESGSKDSSPFVRIGEERVSCLDIESFHTVKIIGLAHLISYVPLLVTLSYSSGCLQQHIPEEANNCSMSLQILFYLRELVSIPCFSFSPVYFIFRSQDIRTALLKRMRCCKKIRNNTNHGIRITHRVLVLDEIPESPEE